MLNPEQIEVYNIYTKTEVGFARNLKFDMHLASKYKSDTHAYERDLNANLNCH